VDPGDAESVACHSFGPCEQCWDQGDAERGERLGHATPSDDTSPFYEREQYSSVYHSCQDNGADEDGGGGDSCVPVRLPYRGCFIREYVGGTWDDLGNYSLVDPYESSAPHLTAYDCRWCAFSEVDVWYNPAHLKLADGDTFPFYTGRLKDWEQGTMGAVGLRHAGSGGSTDIFWEEDMDVFQDVIEYCTGAAGKADQACDVATPPVCNDAGCSR